MANLFVCKICGEPYIGTITPTECPFCGAPQNFIKGAEEYKTLWGEAVSEKEKTDLQATLALEVNATAYYDKVAKTQPKYSKYNRLYKALARTELEHAEVAAKILGVEVPQLKGEDSRGSIEKDLERTKELEEHATEVYQGFVRNAEHQAVKNLYVALIHAEKGHAQYAASQLKK